MTGSFGKTATDDGVVGVTKGRGKSGVLGRNDAKQAPPAGKPGGAGVLGLTGAPSGAGVFGANTHPTKGVGVQGNGPEAGVSGYSLDGAGVRGYSDHGNGGEVFAHDSNGNGLLSMNDATVPATTADGAPHGCGILGVTTVPGAAGVFGANNDRDRGVGIQGNGPSAGVSGYSDGGAGARAFSVSSNGVEGFAEGSGLLGRFQPGLTAKSALVERIVRDSDAEAARIERSSILAEGDVHLEERRHDERRDRLSAGTVEHSRMMAEAGGWLSEAPVRGGKTMAVGVHASAADLAGLVHRVEDRPTGNGVWGHTKVRHGSGVFGTVEPGLRDAAGVTGVGTVAGQFFGNLVVTNDVHVGGRIDVARDVVVGGDVRLSGADLAEEFDITDPSQALPGTVMVIDAGGGLEPSKFAYDRAVAGVVSGAGRFRPGVILDNEARPDAERVTVALVGKVYCRVDADHGSVDVGDLLTTSPTAGHAMKAADRERAFGSVLGKALQPLPAGRALVPILIALQ